MLLDLLDLRDCTVTIDAMGCQTAIATQIVARGGDYLLALKGNQPQVHADVVALFADARSALQPAYGMTHATTIDKGHGRIEQRQAFVISDPSVIAYLNDQDRWTGLRSVVVIESERTLNDVTTTEQRYYLSSQVLDPVTANHHVRAHWGIENSVHWVLDVTFNKLPRGKPRGIDRLTQARVAQHEVACTHWYALVSPHSLEFGLQSHGVQR